MLLYDLIFKVRVHFTYNGQAGGNRGRNVVLLVPSFVMHDVVAGLGSPSPTPPSPELKVNETPRAPVGYYRQEGMNTQYIE